jgi:serine/threonine-protein kinase RsbW
MAGSGDAVSKGQEVPFPVAEFDHDKLQVVANVTLHADVNEITPFIENLMKMISQMECAQGKEYDCTQKVQCCVACDVDRGMLIVVRNPGNGFDVDSVPNPTMGDNVFSNHGRGIYMINQLMDEVKWMKNGTEIHMVKY